MWKFSNAFRPNNGLCMATRRITDGGKLRCSRNVKQNRHYSTQDATTKSGGGRIILGTIGGTLIVVGGTVGYAKFDPKFRSWLEDYLPLLKEPLDFVIGEKEPKITPKPTVTLPTQTKDKVGHSSILQKKIDRDAIKKESDKTIVAIPPPAEKAPEVSVPIVKTVPEKVTEVPAADPDPVINKPSSTTLKQQTASNLPDSNTENTALETKLRDSVSQLQSALTASLSAYQQAVTAINDHTRSIVKVLEPTQDASRETVWKEFSSALEKRNLSLSSAEAVALQARTALQNVQQVVTDGRRSKLTSSNRSLIAAEEAINNAVYNLQVAETEVAKAQSETNAINEYKELIEQGRKKFNQQLETLISDTKLVGKENLSNEEANFLIAFAQRRVEQLQSQLQQQQDDERKHVQHALESQFNDLNKIAQNRTTIELAKQHRELEILYQKKLIDLNDELEHELRQQLRRQAAAHTDHVREVLVAQESELARKYLRVVEDSVGEARAAFQNELAGSLGRLKAIDDSLTARADLEKANRRAQRLWLACVALQQSIKQGRPDAKSWEEKRKPLQVEVVAIRNAAGDEDNFAKVVLDTVRAEALEHGVLTEDALKDRFVQVVRQCRRVALVGDQGGSLLRYAMSYLQSLLMVFEPKLSAAEARDDAVLDVEQLDTFDVLNRAHWHMQRDNLEQTVRFLSLLKGAPRQVARDWLQEARLLLETRQAALVLLAHAASVGVQADRT